MTQQIVLSHDQEHIHPKSIRWHLPAVVVDFISSKYYASIIMQYLYQKGDQSRLLQCFSGLPLANLLFLSSESESYWMNCQFQKLIILLVKWFNIHLRSLSLYENKVIPLNSNLSIKLLKMLRRNPTHVELSRAIYCSGQFSRSKLLQLLNPFAGWQEGNDMNGIQEWKTRIFILKTCIPDPRNFWCFMEIIVLCKYWCFQISEFDFSFNWTFCAKGVGYVGQIAKNCHVGNLRMTYCDLKHEELYSFLKQSDGAKVRNFDWRVIVLHLAVFSFSWWNRLHFHTISSVFNSKVSF